MKNLILVILILCWHSIVAQPHYNLKTTDEPNPKEHLIAEFNLSLLAGSIAFLWPLEDGIYHRFSIGVGGSYNYLLLIPELSEVNVFYEVFQLDAGYRIKLSNFVHIDAGGRFLANVSYCFAPQLGLFSNIWFGTRFIKFGSSISTGFSLIDMRTPQWATQIKPLMFSVSFPIK